MKKLFTITLALIFATVQLSMANVDITATLNGILVEDAKTEFEVILTKAGTSDFHIYEMDMHFDYVDANYSNTSLTFTPSKGFDQYNVVLSASNGKITIHLKARNPNAGNTVAVPYSGVSIGEFAFNYSTFSTISGFTWNNSTNFTAFLPQAAKNLALITSQNLNYLNPVPVELISFTATTERDNVVLNWVTASELNNSHFEVEKSRDGRNWTTIARVAGNGTKETTTRYSYTDLNNSANAYYRLKQVDFGGASEYSRIITVNSRRQINTQVYPTATTVGNNVNVNLKNNYNSMAQVSVVNLLGQVIYSSSVEGNSFEIPTGNFARGNYIVSIAQEGSVETHRLILQ